MMTTPVFSSEFNKFFIDLASNNNKEWFDENRRTYEKEIKEPFRNFVAEMIEEIRKEDKNITLEPKNAIFRINRDIRFAKDKSPYKLFMAAAISPSSKKDMAYPGFYFQLGPESIYMAGGSYQPDKDQLLKIRQSIASDLKGFKKAYSDPEFKNKFGEIRGEKNKVVPKDLKEAANQEPLILNKQFYYEASLPANMVTDKDLVGKMMNFYYASSPVRDFLIHALKD